MTDPDDRRAYDELVAQRNADIARARGNMPRIREIWDRYADFHPLPADIEVEAVRAGDAPGEWCRPPRTDGGRILLYLHGGGYCFGSTTTHRRLYAELGRDAGCSVLAVDYRLAPEHPFPAALDDAESAWNWLRQGGYKADSIAVAGDSAGGGLALALVQRLLDAERHPPCALLLMSPWVNLTAEHIAGGIHSDGEGASPDNLNAMARAYAGESERNDRLISPIGGAYAGAPPVLIQASTDEVLVDDAVAMTRVLARDRVAVCLDLWPGQPHVWQAYWPLLDRARPAIARAGSWIGRHWP